jgi:hypothetical protein
MTEPPPPPIGYADTGATDPADHVLSKIIGVSCVLYGGGHVLSTSVHIALAKGWLASPPSMAWSMGSGWNTAFMGWQILSNCLFIVAGLMILRRAAVGITLLRLAAVSMVLNAVASLVVTLRELENYASYWSTIGSGTVNAIQFLNGLSVPALLALLTLPPLNSRLAR